jgi:hypothetical protein
MHSPCQRCRYEKIDLFLQQHTITTAVELPLGSGEKSALKYIVFMRLCRARRYSLIFSRACANQRRMLFLCGTSMTSNDNGQRQLFIAKLFSLHRLLFLAICLMGISQLAIAASDNLPQKILRPDHVVIVVEENKSFKQIIGNMATPYINTLAKTGALFTQSFGIIHPSQPNYLALFSGNTHGAVDNRCPLTLSGDNLASELKRQGLTFAIYSESMPSPGYTGCQVGHYVRKHNPAANWQSLGSLVDINLPFTRFPTDFSKLPTVSMVVPNQQNDMHKGTFGVSVTIVIAASRMHL